VGSPLLKRLRYHDTKDMERREQTENMERRKQTKEMEKVSTTPYGMADV